MHIFLCEDSIDGIFTGIYDAWASRVGHDRVKLEAGPEICSPDQSDAPVM